MVVLADVRQVKENTMCGVRVQVDRQYVHLKVEPVFPIVLVQTNLVSWLKPETIYAVAALFLHAAVLLAGA